MRMKRVLGVFGLLLALSIFMNLGGALMLRQTNGFLAANFVLNKQVQDALDRTLPATALKDLDVARTSKTLSDVYQHNAQCETALSGLIHRVMRPSDRASVAQSCNALRFAVQRAIDRADTVASAQSLAHVSKASPTVIAELKQSLRLLKDEFQKFHLLTVAYQRKLETGLFWAFALASAGLMALYFSMAGRVIQAWRSRMEERYAVERLSRRFVMAFESAGEGLALFDRDGRLVHCNDIYRRAAHNDPDSIKVGMTARDIVTSAIRSGFISPPKRMRDGELPDDVLSYIAALPDGLTREIAGDRHICIRVHRTDEGESMLTTSEITGLIRDQRMLQKQAHDLKLAKEAMEQISKTDPLTGLPNRRQLDTLLGSRKDAKDAPLIRIDLDHFKQVNDILGHDAGDHVLCTVAEIMRKHTREQDLPVRIGGDEFVIACAPGTGLEGAIELGERLLDDIREPVYFGAKRCAFGASLGIAQPDDSTRDTDDLLRDADIALYHSKNAGRGIVTVFSPEMRRSAQLDRSLADHFAKALKEGEIVPFFQTRHHAETWEISGVEVLARWVHPDEGTLTPNRFLPIVRQMGMEAELDAVVFESALAAIHILAEQGLEVPHASFNVSAARIVDPQFLPMLRAVEHADRERLSFEILETMSANSMGETLKFAIEALKDLGFRIEVDDFGSGQASLNALFDIQPHALKLDRTLIDPLGENDRADTMVSATVEIARTTGVEIIAEGVDSAEKAILLAERGCDQLQGFYFSRPMPLAVLAEYLRHQPQLAMKLGLERDSA